jgi:hypothetical protein
MANNATVTVSFGINGTTTASQNYHLSAEIREDLNGGKTSFAPGEIVIISIYASPELTITSTTSSAGTLALSSSKDTVTKQDELMFENSVFASLPVPAKEITAKTWIGRDLGAITLSSDGMSAKISSAGVGVANITYSAEAYHLALTSPNSLGLDNFSILVYIEASAE